jgi:hypothetical protein
MKKFLLSIFTLCFFTAGAQNCDELFISEYVEGTWNNKAIEIYNPTSAAIDLSDYIIIRYSNGSGAVTSQNAVQLTGSIDPLGVHVGVIEKLDPNGVSQETPVWDTLQAKADAFYCPDYNTSFAFYFNGNDAVVLAKGSVNEASNSQIIDIFGKIGENPGEGWTNIAPFTSAGYSWTENHTLIRKSSVKTGVINNPLGFNVGLEWDSLAVNNFDNLGSHTCDCASATAVGEINKGSYVLYPNPASRGDLVTVKSNATTKNIIITNILGEQVSFENSINTSSLSKGMYIVDVEFSNGKYSNSKLIID